MEVLMSTSTKTLEALATRDYKWGFVSDIEADAIPAGLNEDVIRLISAKKGEPEFMLEWRLKAYRRWLTMQEPHHWANVQYPALNYQDIIDCSAARTAKPLGSLDGVGPELRR